MKFTKMHLCEMENDFIVVDGPLEITPERARLIATGVAASGRTES